MSISRVFLGEFDHEMANTRRALERVPDENLEWQPHPRSMSLRQLATHIANLPHWAGRAMREESFDLAPREGEAPRAPDLRTRAEIVEFFDRNVATARAAIAETTDERFRDPWTLLQGGENVFTMPRTAVLRFFVLNHLVHHRGQLTVYLRLNGVPVPALYGPSADEQPDAMPASRPRPGSPDTK